MKKKYIYTFTGFIFSLFLPMLSEAKLVHIKENKSSDYAETQYPILMVHGFGAGIPRLGDDEAGLNQFYQITPDLVRNGANVFIAQISPYDGTDVRGEQLLQQVDLALAISGKSKLNLIGHSFGAQTSRYIEIVAPEKIASITAVAGTIKGTPVANSMIENKILNPLGKFFIGNLLAPLSGNSESEKLSINYEQAISDLSVKGAEEFNHKYPSAAIPKDCTSDGATQTPNGIYHYSWIGSSKITNIIDIADSTIIAVTSKLMQGENNNDGLVPICSARYGKVIRTDYNLNHFDVVNQILGLKGVFAPDPIAIFRQHANRLKNQGL